MIAASLLNVVTDYFITDFRICQTFVFRKEVQAMIKHFVFKSERIARPEKQVVKVFAVQQVNKYQLKPP